jgi:hypothetical protein
VLQAPDLGDDGVDLVRCGDELGHSGAAGGDTLRRGLGKILEGLAFRQGTKYRSSGVRAPDGEPDGVTRRAIRPNQYLASLRDGVGQPAEPQQRNAGVAADTARRKPTPTIIGS